MFISIWVYLSYENTKWSIIKGFINLITYTYIFSLYTSLCEYIRESNGNMYWLHCGLDFNYYSS